MRGGVVLVEALLQHIPRGEIRGIFYISAWEYFLSGYKDTDAGRAGIGHAVPVLTEGAEIARSWLARRPAGNTGEE